jgi:hypothetical protein
VTGEAAKLHERGVAATARGAPVAGAAHLRRGLRLLGWPQAAADRALTARLLISLAHAEAEQGRPDAGLRLLDEARQLADPADHGVCDQQRGLLLLRAGRFTAARDCFDAALPLLTAAAHRGIEARTLLNRGVALQATGQIALARKDFRRCAAIATSAGLDRLAIKAEHNTGYCDYLGSDIPAALRAYANAERALGSEAGLLGVVLLDRARALLTAGLFREAQRDLDRAIDLFAGQRLRQDQAEAELARAQTALAARDDAAATRWARRARSRFLRRGNSTGAALAALVLLRVRFSAGPQRAGLAAESASLAAGLRHAGLADDADLAMLAGARSLIARGELAAAEALLPASPARFAPMELRLIRHLAAAELAVASGRGDAALRQVSASLAALHAQRSRLGSLDLRAGTVSPAVELAALGTALAWDTGSARRAYAMTEQARAQSLRIRSVRPVPDPRLAAVIAALRQAHTAQRQAALAGEPPSAELRSRLAELRRLIRSHDWETGGSGHTYAVAPLPEVTGQLERHNAVMVSLVEYRGRLGAIVVGPGTRRTATMVELGSRAVATELVKRVRADVDILASRLLPGRLERSLRGSLAASLASVDAIFAQAEAAIARHAQRGQQLVIIPTGSWWLLPWGALPSLRSRPVCVCPSATSWIRGAAARAPDARSPGQDVVIGGPGLAAAPAEVAAVASRFAAARVLNAGQATVAAALDAMDGAGTVHIAAHAEHDPDNGLFSRIWLSDGPLMAYELQQLARPPGQVVLAACDAGRAAVHPGDDLLGLASAFLQAGTQTVIASVARVADDAAQHVMGAYHQFLAAQRSPAEALAAALTDDPLVPFVCFGVG